jgi:hypothetical protein
MPKPQYPTPPKPVNKKAATSSQLKFRCPRKLYEQLELAKAGTGQTTQQICVDALEAYLHRDVGGKKLTHEEWLAHFQEAIRRHPDLYNVEGLELYQKIQEKMKQEIAEFWRENSAAIEEAFCQAKVFPVIARSRNEQLWMEFVGRFLREMPAVTVTSVQQVMLDLMDLFISSGRKKPKEDQDGSEAK